MSTPLKQLTVNIKDHNLAYSFFMNKLSPMIQLMEVAKSITGYLAEVSAHKSASHMNYHSQPQSILH